jgi:hypothetical protein
MARLIVQLAGFAAKSEPIMAACNGWVPAAVVADCRFSSVRAATLRAAKTAQNISVQTYKIMVA